MTTPNSEGRYVFEAVVGKTYTITATDNAGNTSDVRTVEIKDAAVSTPLAIENVAVDNSATPAQSKQVSFTVNVPAGQGNLEIAVQSPTNKAVKAVPGPVPVNSNTGYFLTYTFAAE